MRKDRCVIKTRSFTILCRRLNLATCLLSSSEGQARASIISDGPVVFGPCRYLLNTQRAALLWTISILAFWVLVWGSQTVLHYSTWGLTKDL